MWKVYDRQRRRHTTDDERNLMANAHMAFGQVSYKGLWSWCLKKLSINLHNILNQLPPQGDTISCNGTERNETKRNNFVSCFSNYYWDITILRNETIPFRVLVISYRWTVLSYFVPTKTRPTYICTRCSRAIWAFGGWVVYCTTHGRFSTCFHLKFAIYFLKLKL
jgi:hypothetical protein